MLSDSDPLPVVTVNPGGRSPFLIIGDHAGNVIPSSLGRMGIGSPDLCRHIAWDIGVAGLGLALAERLDAVFLRQTYSRLVIDCNRAPGSADAMPAVSDRTIVPANAALTPEERTTRIDAIHAPYHRAIADELARRDREGRASILIALHSFTPAMSGGPARPWHAGILHDGGDPSFALALLAALRREADLIVGDNEPYRMDQVDYTLPLHAYPLRRRYAEIEIRQDLLADEQGQRRWASILERCLLAASATDAG